MPSVKYFDRDISWLSFNERLLIEASKETLPLLERFNFLAIYSSNLDEFYRVRIPALMALHKLYKKKSVNNQVISTHSDVLEKVKEIIDAQLNSFGTEIRRLIPQLKLHNITLIYAEPIPQQIQAAVSHYFFSEVLAFIQPIDLNKAGNFFPENNQLYIVAISRNNQQSDLTVVKIPTKQLSRFFSVTVGGHQYICFLDDIIKANMRTILPGVTVDGSFSFKVTRDAELNLEEIYEGDIADKIEKQITKRDYGYATRLLFESGFPKETVEEFVNKLEFEKAIHTEGGPYHNLKDLSSIPISIPTLKNTPWKPKLMMLEEGFSLFEKLLQSDLLIHTPYYSYDMVLRFFNEASIDPKTTEIYTTMYRVANDSSILNALVSAAINGKKVTVLVELKARFDEANNVKWSKKLKAAGVKVLYTETQLKVHAKVALVKKNKSGDTFYFGLLATGNLNEITARIYTDHILMTSHTEMLQEIESVFSVFDKKVKLHDKPVFNHLLVAQFNLRDRFIELIEREITAAKKGLEARIIIKLNNLEEKVLIKKLYQASNAGVKIDLIVRSICTLIPGVVGMSENITVRRIVDRYLEHGRIFVFYNTGESEIYLGSADWMKRNIYKRIEVCFPVYDQVLKQEIMALLEIQLKDNVQAVHLDTSLRNVPIENDDEKVQSQQSIYHYLMSK